MKNIWAVTGILLAMLLAGPVQADDSSRAIKEDKQHIKNWNLFAKKLYQLHLQRIKGRDIEVKSKVGGYKDQPEFYIQDDFIDKATGKMLSRIQWEKAAGNKELDTIHVIQIYYYDKQGRLIRDYSAAYLPGSRNAPIQTLASLHHYDGDLHGFRNFDASGETIYESCEGTYKGEQIFISLEDYDIFEIRRDATGMTAHPAYAKCFGNLPEDGKKFISRYLTGK
jgi:hypothetical protein